MLSTKPVKWLDLFTLISSDGWACWMNTKPAEGTEIFSIQPNTQTIKVSWMKDALEVSGMTLAPCCLP